SATDNEFRRHHPVSRDRPLCFHEGPSEMKMSDIESAGRRRLLRMSLAAGGLATAGALLSVRAFAGGKATVSMQLGWIPGGNQVGEVVAKRLGYYEQEGID